MRMPAQNKSSDFDREEFVLAAWLDIDFKPPVIVREPETLGKPVVGLVMRCHLRRLDHVPKLGILLQSFVLLHLDARPE
jgi:hypothetical protein